MKSRVTGGEIVKKKSKERNVVRKNKFEIYSKFINIIIYKRVIKNEFGKPNVQ